MPATNDSTILREIKKLAKDSAASVSKQPKRCPNPNTLKI